MSNEQKVAVRQIGARLLNLQLRWFRIEVLTSVTRLPDPGDLGPIIRIVGRLVIRCETNR
ncbi:MAG: hypothetical protein BRD55_06630 [Bacteroidetes bacterium SW_9_63_38]|nr:MAG: hypothetical protein BRD55_06630 [Bacteroidetes bacterium SW_9_63_38]